MGGQGSGPHQLHSLPGIGLRAPDQLMTALPFGRGPRPHGQHRSVLVSVSSQDADWSQKRTLAARRSVPLPSVSLPLSVELCIGARLEALRSRERASLSNTR